ncbi:MAG: penicillin-insensitive murein endopeptidase [Pseudomonadota bacterium]
MRYCALLPTAIVAFGCVSAPTPLAPSLGGSVGFPHHGVQTNAIELPVRGKGFVRYRPESDKYWGLPRLVRAIQDAAAHVEREFPGGAPVVVGDLSARHGGKIPKHHSHRSGRDIDLLYYVTTPSGVPVQNPGFYSILGDGLAEIGKGEFVRIDIPRQWAFFKHLLQNEEIGVQFLFVSQDVEALLIDYALSRNEPLDLVYRAQTVLLQPRDSSPHADHVHVRIACAPEEWAMGCSGGGPYWDWLPGLPEAGPVEPHVLEAIALEDSPFEAPLAESGAPSADGGA